MKRKVPAPIELFFMLVDTCMRRLSPNAWKIVCYVAARHIRIHSEWLMSIRDPALYALHRDTESIGILLPSGEDGGYRYRADSKAPPVPGELVGRFAVISLDELCRGKRTKRRWRDHGTGLSKSSVAEAIKEGVRCGILVHQRNKSWSGRDQASLYAIDWDRVQELDWRRRKGLT